MRVLESEGSRRMTYNIPSRETKPEHDGERYISNNGPGQTSFDMAKIPDTQIAKFYRKYGEDWVERYRRSKEAEI